MRRRWDVVVIGAGAAGLAAAGSVAGAGLSCACFERLAPGGVLMNLGRIDDLPDVASGETGAVLAGALIDRATDAGVEMVFGEVRALAGGPPWVVTADDAAHEARAVVIASGLSHGTLGIPGEEAFEGRGLSHCVACDGPLFAGQDVVVTGNDRWTLQEALELSEIACRVTLVGDAGERRAPPAGIVAVPGRVVALAGADGLESVTVAHGDGREAIAARGLFAYQDRRPELGYAADRLVLDSRGRVRVDERLLTGLPFVFAVGDARAGSTESVAGAVADGRRAGLLAARLLNRHGDDASPDTRPLA